jgi:hypothetical protein
MVKPIKHIELLKVITETSILRHQIDEHLNDGYKISAIGELKKWCKASENPDWLKNGTRVSLRLMKEVIDIYATRNNIYNKLCKLQEAINRYCHKHGFDNMGHRKGAKSKDGLYVHKYTDYEMIGDHLKFIVNNLQWSPSRNEYKEYNSMWKKYNATK